MAVLVEKERGARREIVERYGGFIISLCVNIVLYSFLLTAQLPRIEVPAMQRLSVMLRPPAPTPAPIPTPTVPLMIPPAAKTTAAEAPPQPAETPKQEEPEPPPQAPTHSAQRISEEMLRSLESQKHELAMQEQEVEREKEKMRTRVQALAARDGGGKFAVSTDGAAQGAARRLVLRDYPQSIVNTILKRYDIQITTRYISAGKSFSYLNTAETAQGTYYNQSGAGLFEVFQLSRKALAKMVELEVAEMQRRGLDPNRTRTIEVEFGIVKQGNDYDLGIISFKAEEIK